ncbi:hypothetical protein K439DRAFT_1025626 [Ramaria rubella]|nr:hypothetical protein K439DRAFT_1025626 [Ramaria rubella]
MAFNFFSKKFPTFFLVLMYGLVGHVMVKGCFMKLALGTRFARTRPYSTDETRKNCLSLMRATAQSVSVITTMLSTSPSQHGEGVIRPPTYHGATLSSFTSIAMYPHPFVSFALRTPSRMADSLEGIRFDNQEGRQAHLVINLLSASQADLALQFSRPRDDPFASTPYSLSSEGIPILRGCLGALSCTLVNSFPLRTINPTYSEGLNGDLERDPGDQESELFVAKVLRVESGLSPGTKFPREQPEEFENSMLPLVYHRQQFVTIDPTRRL